MTIQDLNRRLEQHQGNAEEKQMGGHFYYAIRKYGWDDFTTEILEEVTSDLAEREVYWIDYYNTFHGDGYNMTPGGEGGSFPGELNGMYGKTHTDDWKVWQGDEMKRRWESGVYANRDFYGEKNCFYKSVPARDLRTGETSIVSQDVFWENKYNKTTGEGYLVGGRSKASNF